MSSRSKQPISPDEVARAVENCRPSSAREARDVMIGVLRAVGYYISDIAARYKMTAHEVGKILSANHSLAVSQIAGALRAGIVEPSDEPIDSAALARIAACVIRQAVRDAGGVTLGHAPRQAARDTREAVDYLNDRDSRAPLSAQNLCELTNLDYERVRAEGRARFAAWVVRQRVAGGCQNLKWAGIAA
jgi:hypothetical protein